ncbi:phosphatase PAP2 family protein [Leifsonia sp. 22587]|uniref:phosphatase PAP2 family protein n=1 Tax=Leifsonia sp. 22587 TaxID=3453946 RepID=UPI003F854E4F
MSSTTPTTLSVAVPLDPRARMAVLPHPRHWILWPAFGAAIVVAFGLLIRFVPAITAAEVQLDVWLTRHQNGLSTAIALTIEALFSPAGSVVILAVSFLFLLLVRRSPVNAVAFTWVAGFGYLACEVFKTVVSMPRPDGHLMLHPLLAETGQDSFPSGHTTFAVSYAAAAVLLAHRTRWSTPIALLGTLLVVVVAVSRMYVGAHYLTDVIGSVLVAAVAISFACGLWSRFGLIALDRLPFLRRIGSVPPPTVAQLPPTRKRGHNARNGWLRNDSRSR